MGGHLDSYPIGIKSESLLFESSAVEPKGGWSGSSLIHFPSVLFSLL